MAGPSTPGPSSPSPLSAPSIPSSLPSSPPVASIFGGGQLGGSLNNSTNTNTAPATATASTASNSNLATPAAALTGSGVSATSATSATSAASSSNNTYIMPNSPIKNRPADGYRPRVIRTLGQRPACLVNASVTYCGNNQIYAFGGFDQYTDEVYNHVLRLDLVSKQWSLVDNYGDIPGVRMGHTATLYQGDKLLVFGGENEHRTYLSDLIVFDLKTAHWTQPAVTGPIPKGRARHAAVLHEDKLFIMGGITGHDSYVLDDICYLDLKTFCWSRSWKFVGRFDHSAYVWGDRVWVFGGLREDNFQVSDLLWLDLKGSPAFQSPPAFGSSLSASTAATDRSSSLSLSLSSPRTAYAQAIAQSASTTGYAANSRTAQVNTPSHQIKAYAPTAPGTISTLKFNPGPNIPNQLSGIHFHVYTSGMLLDFVTPAPTVTSRECSLSTLDLATLRWQRLAEGREIFRTGYRWHYCTMNEDGTKAWLLGCPTDPSTIELGPNGGLEEYLSDIMEIDLRRYGFLGNPPDAHAGVNTLGSGFSSGFGTGTLTPSRVRHADPPSQGLGSDLARLFDQPPETGSGADFIVTAHAGEELDSSEHSESGHWLSPDAPTSAPIHVHRLILQARWPHFARLWASQMAEFHTKKMHIPEPYTVVRAFLFYLYTDRIDCKNHSLSDVAGLLVMSNIYNIPHLRLLCANRLAKELDVDHACIIWHCASLASETWLRKRAAAFCLEHWGRIVRSPGFLRLPRAALVELSQEIDSEGRVIGGDEVDMYGSALEEAGGRYSGSSAVSRRKESVSSRASGGGEDGELDGDGEEEEDEDVEMN